MTADLVRVFPAPPRWVRHALEQSATPSRADRAPDTVRMPGRPWDPAGCPAQLRGQLWPWLDDVAAWINHEYGWQTAHVIPSCWPRHPYLVHELAVLACLRAAAAEAPGPQPLEDWHRYALPGFLARMTDRLGVGCAPGRHTDWPARSRHTEYASPEAADIRSQLFEADAGAPGSTPTPRPPHPGAVAYGGHRRERPAVPDSDEEGAS